MLDVGDYVLWLDPEDSISSNHHIIVSILTDSRRVENIDTILIIQNDQGEYNEVIAAEIV
tara:strand:- start:125 stop:304 length:180 start_codon:yes stop_codon:yes gene_type:complete